uniref:Uncharacterized protein n=1 Tax=Ditylum brightwellii TaxID=49249 RepID=A0A7S4RT69_9STRA
MRRCIERGELREEILRRTIVPIFLRTVHDVRAALDVAVSIDVKDATTDTSTRPGALLQLIDCQSIQGITSKEGDDPLGGAFDLFWAIHLNLLINAGPTTAELNSIKAQARGVFHKIYDSKKGVPSSFTALCVRKRTRSK